MKVAWRWVVFLAVVVAVSGSAAGCGSPTATPPAGTAASASASASGAAASASSSAAGWIAARVEQPGAIEGSPSDAPAFCSPCHPIVGTYISALVAAGPGYVALGQESPPSRAAVWTSSDAASWTRVASLPGPTGSLIAAAITASGRVLAVGAAGGAAAVWHSADGLAWQLQALPPPPSGQSEQLAAVAAVNGGFIAAGFAEDALAVKRATFWRSADGERWTRVAVPAASGPTEVTGLAGTAANLVAVGIAGDERRGSGVVWRSTDGGASWSAPDTLAIPDGRPLSVAFDGATFAAVGENQAQTAAAAWSSTDGATWAPVAASSALTNYGQEMVMEAVAPEPSGGFVADGWKSDAGNGTAVVWTSPDGRAWSVLPTDDSFLGAGMAAILPATRLLAAGSKGWPDTHAAQVWVAPDAIVRP